MGNKHKKHSDDKERTDVLKNKKKNDDIRKKRKKGKKKEKKHKKEKLLKKEKGQRKEKAQKEEKSASKQKKNNDEKKEEIKAKIIVKIIVKFEKVWKEFKWYLIAICILTLIIAYIFEKIGYGTLVKVISAIFGLISCTYNLIVIIAGKLKKNGLFNETHTIQLGIYAKEAFRRVLHNKKIVQIIMTVLIILISAVTWSKYTVFARIKEGVSAFKTSFLNYSEEEIESKEEDGAGITEKLEDPKEELIPGIADDISGEDLYVYTEEEIIEQFGRDNYMEVKNILMTYNDRNLEVSLSYDDYAQVFFQNGKYKIEDWNNQVEVDEKVLQSIEDAVAQNNQNIFDGSAPNDLKNKIDTLGKKGEKKITFAERIEITEFREMTYEQYPKSTLALLSANDNQAYALALVLIGGKQQTQMYYYGQSVLWGMKYISYEDVSDRALRQRINWIAKRYEDIRFICSKEEAEYIYADRLMTAYRHASEAF